LAGGGDLGGDLGGGLCLGGGDLLGGGGLLALGVPAGVATLGGTRHTTMPAALTSDSKPPLLTSM
jgi:hypothetical protein